LQLGLENLAHDVSLSGFVHVQTFAGLGEQIRNNS
jgi:hypothetical protein